MGNNKKRIAVIMAGGSGERIWPLSRRNKPKQFLHLTDRNKTLLAQSVSNISPLFQNENIFLATGKHLVTPSLNSNIGIPAENIIAEPLKRNTSGCLALTAAELLSRCDSDSGDITMGVFPADHIISDPERFRLAVDAALSAAEKAPVLVTLGIKPDRPETGYGYIKITGEIEFNIDGIPAYSVDRFCEKPDLKTAQEYLSTGLFYWNSGIFFWRLSTFLDEIGHASPDLLKAIEDMTDALKSGNQKRLLTVFEGLEDISIDYALMEKANRVLVLEADFGWDDIGAWDALDRILPADEHGNVVVGEPIMIDSENCIVYNAPGLEKTAVGIVGVEGLAVIVSDDGVLVVPKDRAQDVKKVVSELKKRDAKQL